MPVAQLPESVRRLLQQQGSGFYDTPNQASNSGQTMSALQAAAARRFGQSGEFDQEYNAGVRGLMGQIPDLEARYQNNRNRMDEDFTLGAERENRDNDLNNDRHTNTMADRGLGHSGANLVGQGRIAEGFQRNVQGLVSNRARGMSDLTGAQNSAYRNIEARAGELQGQAAGRANVRDQQRAWEAEQQRMQMEQAAQQQKMAEQQLQMQQAAIAQAEASQRRMEQQMLQQAQPRASSTGSYTPAPPPPPPPLRPIYPGVPGGEPGPYSMLPIKPYDPNYDSNGSYIGNM